MSNILDRIAGLFVLYVLLAHAVVPAMGETSMQQYFAKEQNKPQVVGDPIDASSGNFYFREQIWDLGGPMPLRYDLRYGTDQVYGSGLFGAGNRFDHAIPGFQFADTNEVGFFGAGSDDTRIDFVYDATNTEWNVWSAHALGYRLRETQRAADYTNGYFYFMHPREQRVYMFEKYMPDPMTRKARLRCVMDRNGNRHLYTYGTTIYGVQYLSRIEDTLGRVIDVTVQDTNWAARVVRVTDHAGRSFCFEYDSYPNLVSVGNPMGGKVQYIYGDASAWGYVTARITPIGNCPYSNAYVQTWLNGVKYRMVDKQTDAYGNTMTLNYDSNSVKVTAIYADGTTNVYEHWCRYGAPRKMTDQTGRELTFQQDGSGRIIGARDRMGNQYGYSYDPATGFVLSKTNPLGHVTWYTYTNQTQTVTNPINSETVEFTFTSLSRIMYPDGTSEEFVRDNRGNVAQYRNGRGDVWQFMRNAQGLPTTVLLPTGGAVSNEYAADGRLIATATSSTGPQRFGYDSAGRVVSVTNADGTVVAYAWDAMDRLTGITNELGDAVSREYDADGQLIAFSDAQGSRMAWAYDAMGRVIRETNYLGGVTTYAYDRMGRLASVTNPVGLATIYSYDANGRLRSRREFGVEVQYTRNLEGQPTATIFPSGRTWEYEYDAAGSLKRITDPSGAATVWTYDEMGRVKAETNALGKATRYTCDAAGNMTSIHVDGAGMVSYSNNALGQVVEITDFNGRVWRLGRDSMGQLISVTDPLNNTWTHVYDARGRVHSTICPDGVSWTNFYDAAGNLTNRIYSTGLSLYRQYNANGDVISADGIALSYNRARQITNTAQDGIHFGAEFDIAGRLTALTYNNNAMRVVYTYEPDSGRLLHVSDTLSGAAVTFQYDADGFETNIIRGGAAPTTAVERDTVGRIRRIQHGAIADLRYTRNAIGQVVETSMDAPVTAGATLTSEIASYSYNAASQIESAGYGFDARGRMTNSPARAYEWDAADRLVRAGIVRFEYNGMGDLRRRISGTSTQEFFYNYALNSRLVMAERDATSGTFQRYYVWTPQGELLYAVDVTGSPKAYYYLFDGAGNTIGLTDSNGMLKAAYAYDPFGRITASTGSVEHLFFFAGQWGMRKDGQTDLHQAGVRYYDASIARFLTGEPQWPMVDEPLTINPYIYALNNPLMYHDTVGLAPEKNTFDRPDNIRQQSRQQESAPAPVVYSKALYLWHPGTTLKDTTKAKGGWIPYDIYTGEWKSLKEWRKELPESAKKVR